MDPNAVKIVLESLSGVAAVVGALLGLWANAFNAKATPPDRVDWPDITRDHTLDNVCARGSRTVAGIRSRAIANLSILTLLLATIAAIAAGHGDEPIFAAIVLALAVGLLVYAVIIGQPLYDLTRRVGLHNLIAEGISRENGCVVPQKAQQILDAVLSADFEEIIAKEKVVMPYLQRLRDEEKKRAEQQAQVRAQTDAAAQPASE